MRLFFVFTILVFSLPHYIFGVGANPNPVTITQPDGTTIQIKVRGDEWNRWVSTTDGYHIVKNSKGIYEYAQPTKVGGVEPSGQRVANITQRSAQEINFLKGQEPKRIGIVPESSSTNKLKSLQMVQQNRQLAASANQSGTFKLLVILANFSDKQTTYSSNQFSSLMNEPNYGGTGSFRDYYLENSNGKLDVVSTVTAWVTVPQTHDYYGPEEKWGEFAYQAIKAAYNSGINLSQFDNNEDGVVDAIAIIHQGNGQESTGNIKDIWSHSHALSYAGYTSSQRLFGSVRADNYIVQPEFNGAGKDMATIGVIAHEFGHALGAYDFYDTDYEENGSQSGTGTWDLMASGNYNGNPMGSVPAHHNPYTKIQLGWANEVLLSEPTSVILPAITASQKVIRFNTTTNNEYYLLEYRKKVGFDSYLRGEGLIVYHVDNNAIISRGYLNELNTSARQAMYIKAANGSDNINTAGCPFPGSSNNIEFHDVTIPNALSWAGQPSSKSVTNIRIENDTIRFDFMSLQDGLPKNFKAQRKSDSEIKLDWELNEKNYKLLIVYSPDNVFGTPQDGFEYEPGSWLPGGGLVLYYDKSFESFAHQVNWESTYHYTLWANMGDKYSSPIKTSVNGFRQVAFYLADRLSSPLSGASVSVGDFNGTTDENGYLNFYGDFAPEKLHRFVAKIDGYEDKWGVFYSDTIKNIFLNMTPNADWIIKFNQESVNQQKISLSWQPVIDENFSGYEPFSLSMNGWRLVDIDKLPTYGINGIDFENEGYTGSFIVFDGLKDSFLNSGYAFGSYTGRQFLASVASNGGTNNDWLISPTFTADSSTWLSFYARSLSATYGLERIKVLVSTNGVSTSNFQKISTGFYLEVPTKWTLFKYDLSGYAGKNINFAINCVSNNAFMLMLDAVKITKEEPMQLKSMSMASSQTPVMLSDDLLPVSKSPVIGNSIKSISNTSNGGINYEIYRNGQLVGTNSGFSSTSFIDNTLNCGKQVYTIKAVAGNGYSAESPILTTFNCIEKTKVSAIAGDLKYSVQLPDGATSATYQVYNVNGILVYSGKLNSYRDTINGDLLPKGLCIVKFIHSKGSDMVKLMNL